MRYGYAMLGETPELFKEAEVWTKAEMEKLEKKGYGKYSAFAGEKKRKIDS